MSVHHKVQNVVETTSFKFLDPQPTSNSSLQTLVRIIELASQALRHPGRCKSCNHVQSLLPVLVDSDALTATQWVLVTQSLFRNCCCCSMASMPVTNPYQRWRAHGFISTSAHKKLEQLGSAILWQSPAVLCSPFHVKRFQWHSACCCGLRACQQAGTSCLAPPDFTSIGHRLAH